MTTKDAPMPRWDAEDRRTFYDRAARQPQPWVDPEPRPTAREIESARLDVRALAESVAEITDEIARMARSRDPDLARWQQMAESAEADLAAARVALDEMMGRRG